MQGSKRNGRKGNRRHPWMKAGMQDSRKHSKKYWKKKVRYMGVDEDLPDGCFYKKFAKDNMFEYVT